MKTYMHEKAGKHFCFKLTSDDAQVAIPMMIASILFLVVLL